MHSGETSDAQRNLSHLVGELEPRNVKVRLLRDSQPASMLVSIRMRLSGRIGIVKVRIEVPDDYAKQFRYAVFVFERAKCRIQAESAPGALLGVEYAGVIGKVLRTHGEPHAACATHMI